MSGLHINSVAYENSTGNLDLTITYTVYMVEKIVKRGANNEKIKKGINNCMGNYI